MIYLQLVQSLSRECGVSGPSSGISTVANASGEAKRLCDWIAQSWREVQLEHAEWMWMLKDVQFDTVLHQQAYPPADAPLSLTDFQRWDVNSFRSYITATGIGSEMFVMPQDYKEFRDYWMFGARRTTYGRPISLTVRPNDKALMIGLAPDQTYTMIGQYYSKPTTLSADADEPEMPDQFHMIIVYRAMIHYGMYEAAPEVVQRGENMYNEMLLRLEIDQLPPVTTAGPLA